MKIICADRVSVGLSYDANFKMPWQMSICVDRVPVRLSYDFNFKWHMLIRGEICRAEQKYMLFFGTVTERDFRKKIQSTETYTNDATLRSGIFFWKTRSAKIHG